MDDGYLGPGIWIRIQHRFGPRMPEWFLAGHMLLFGYVLLLPTETFNQPSFIVFREWIKKDHLEWLMLIVGCARIIGLVVNGARKRVTPQIRQISGAIGCLVWVGISYGFASSDVISTWFAIYPLFVLGELVNIYRAAHDQGEAYHGSIT